MTIEINLPNLLQTFNFVWWVKGANKNSSHFSKELVLWRQFQHRDTIQTSFLTEIRAKFWASSLNYCSDTGVQSKISALSQRRQVLFL